MSTEKMKPEIHKDFFGKPLEPGSTVVFADRATRGMSSYLVTGVVTGRYTKKNLYVRLDARSWAYREEVLKAPHTLIIYKRTTEVPA